MPKRVRSKRDPITAADLPKKFVGSGRIAAITGYTPRHVRTLAAAGKIPGATRLTDDSHWRFDEMRVRAWLRRREVQPRPPISMGAFEVSDFRPKGRSPADTLAQAVEKRRRALREEERRRLFGPSGRPGAH